MANSMKRILEQANDPNLLLLPKINEYLLQHGDEKYSEKAMDAVWSALTTPPRDRSASFSSSSAGQDLRHQELAYLGYPQKAVMPTLQIIFTIGHWLHAQNQAMLLSANIIQDIEVPVGDPEFYSKGSMDGQGFVWWDPVNPNWAGQDFVLEIKTVGSHMWDKKVNAGKPSPDHLDQIHRYFLLSGLRLCSYLMIDKGSYGSDGIVEFVVEADDELLAKSRRELEDLKWAVENKTLHPQSQACKSSAKTKCPYGGRTGFCGTVHKWEPFDKN